MSFIAGDNLVYFLHLFAIWIELALGFLIIDIRIISPLLAFVIDYSKGIYRLLSHVGLDSSL